jgi:hypothetical protein
MSKSGGGPIVAQHQDTKAFEGIPKTRVSASDEKNGFRPHKEKGGVTPR